MKALTITVLVIHALALLIVILDLITKDFPYDKKKTVGGECATGLLCIGFIVWCAILLSR